MFPPQAIDKRNQNIIRSILESPPPANVSHAEEKVREGGRVNYSIVRRGRSTSRVSGKGRRLLQKICSICKQFSNSPAGGNSLAVRTEACCSRKGCFAFRISSVCKTPNPSSLPSRSVRPLHVGSDCRKRDDPYCSRAWRVDGGPVGGPDHLPEGFPITPPSYSLFS